MKNTKSTNPTPMHSLSERSESPELPEFDVMPAVVPAIGSVLKFEPDDRRVGVRVVDVDVDHEEPDELCDEELLCDEVLDDREEL